MDMTTGWRMILIAALANFAFKLGSVAILGHRALTWRVALAVAAAGAAGGALLWFWQ